MPELKKITLENCSRLLYFRGLITQEQLDDVLARGKAQEARLYSHQQSGGTRRSHARPEVVSPAEVLADHEQCGAGGTCFSLTAAFLHLVRSLGWKAEPLLADRRYGCDGPGDVV